MQWGVWFAVGFILILVVVMFLALLAINETVQPIRRGRPKTWRREGSAIDRALKINAAVNETLAIVATTALLAWALIDATTAGLKQFLAWTQLQGLALRALWLVLILYGLFGIASLVSNIARAEAEPLLHRAVVRLQSVPWTNRPTHRDDEALLSYSYAE